MGTLGERLSTALDHRLRVRARPRLRLFVRAARVAAVRRRPSRDVAARLQLGVEIGQLAVLLVLVPALGLLFRYVVPERLGIIILSALVAHTGWHWMLERGEQLAKFPFPSSTPPSWRARCAG